MLVTCHQRDLASSVASILRVVNLRATFPPTLQFVGREGKFFLQSMDLESGVRFEIPAKLEGEGIHPLPLKSFASFVRALPKEELCLEFLPSSLTLKYAAGEAEVPLESEEMPRFPEDTPQVATKLDAQVLKAGARFVVPAASKDDLRPAFTGVLFEFAPSILRLVATDGYRLAFFEEEVSWEGESKRFLCPAHILDKAARMAEGELEIGFTSELAFFKFEKALLSSRLLSDSFPDYARVIPKEYRTRAVLECARLVDAVLRAKAFAQEKTAIVTLVVSSGGCEVRSIGGTGKFRESFACEVEGERVGVAFNVSYLLEPLKAVEVKEVALELNTETSPVVVRESEKRFYLVLPVRVM